MIELTMSPCWLLPLGLNMWYIFLCYNLTPLPSLVGDIIAPPDSQILEQKSPILILVPNICDPFLVGNIITQPDSQILHQKFPHMIVMPDICDPFLVGEIITPPESPMLHPNCGNAHTQSGCPIFVTHFEWVTSSSHHIAPKMWKCPHLIVVPNICDPIFSGWYNHLT